MVEKNDAELNELLINLRYKMYSFSKEEKENILIEAGIFSPIIRGSLSTEKAVKDFNVIQKVIDCSSIFADGINDTYAALKAKLTTEIFPEYVSTGDKEIYMKEINEEIGNFITKVSAASAVVIELMKAQMENNK